MTIKKYNRQKEEITRLTPTWTGHKFSSNSNEWSATKRTIQQKNGKWLPIL